MMGRKDQWAGLQLTDVSEAVAEIYSASGLAISVLSLASERFNVVILLAGLSRSAWKMMVHSSTPKGL